MNFELIHFKCKSCNHKTDIFFESAFKQSELSELGKCKRCEKHLYLNSGDLGYRTDIPNPDYPPWQAQFIRAKKEKSFCSACFPNQEQETTVVDLEAVCPNCNKINMQGVYSCHTKNESLETLLNYLGS